MKKDGIVWLGDFEFGISGDNWACSIPGRSVLNITEEEDGVNSVTLINGGFRFDYLEVYVNNEY